MNNLPIWIGVWNATNQASNEVELTSVEPTVIFILISVIAIATTVFATTVFMD